jgi:hypothetical protein
MVLRGLQEASVVLALSVDSAAANGQFHLGEGAVRDQLAAELRIGIIHVVHAVTLSLC